MRQPADHLLRADLPDLVAVAIPIVEDLVGPFAAGRDRMLRDQRLQSRFPPGRAQAANDDAVRIDAMREITADIEDEAHAAGHARREILAGAAEDNGDAAGHIFAAVR